MKVLILAGGSGTRLWPLSRTHYPKQFLKLGGDESLLKQTIRRSLGLALAADIIIVTGNDYFSEVSRQAEEIDPAIQVVLEPSAKNTAPAIALVVQQLTDDELLLVCPADHTISPIDVFHQTIQDALPLAKHGAMVTFGVRPDRPETGFGYIKGSEFVEKPDLKTAQKYLASGDYFWNSGMFLFSVATFRAEAKEHCPALLGPFAQMPTLSIDYALMERSSKISMVPLELSWSDIGSFEHVHELLPKDEKENAVQGDVVTYDTQNSLVLSSGRLVATIGLDDIIIVESDDVVLVANKKDAQQVKKVVEELKKNGRSETDEHRTTQRPWGTYTVLEDGHRFKIKRIRVEPLQTLSLQLHYHRSEHWVVVSGTAQVTIGEEERVVHEGESIFVPKSSIHRVSNPGKVPLEIIEVQVGEYLGEDDIVRLEDVYGRLREDESFKILMQKTKSST